MAGRRKTAQALALRARIVLAYAEGCQNKEVAAKLGVVEMAVGKWRRRFVRDRLEGLRDEPRPEAPGTIDDARIEATIVKTLESLPKDATHWSSRGMAKESGLSVSSVQRIWRAFGLQPHRMETFKLSTDPDFVAKVRDVVGPYVSPPQRAVVLCVDEKSQIQALDRSQPVLPMRPGQPAQRSHDYTRYGTTSLVAALDIATGKVIGNCYSRQVCAHCWCARHLQILGGNHRVIGTELDGRPESTRRGHANRSEWPWRHDRHRLLCCHTHKLGATNGLTQHPVNNL